jgi:hypothetical protein
VPSVCVYEYQIIGRKLENCFDIVILMGSGEGVQQVIVRVGVTPAGNDRRQQRASRNESSVLQSGQETDRPSRRASRALGGSTAPRLLREEVGQRHKIRIPTERRRIDFE